MFEYLTKLKEEWKELEELTKGILVDTTDTCPLCTRRVGDRIRLVLYKVPGSYTPIVDCKASDMIQAVGYVPEFLNRWFDTRANMCRSSKIAVERLAGYVNDFRKDTHQR